LLGWFSHLGFLLTSNGLGGSSLVVDVAGSAELWADVEAGDEAEVGAGGALDAGGGANVVGTSSMNIPGDCSGTLGVQEVELKVSSKRTDLEVW
jgi:hypothetical protein